MCDKKEQEKPIIEELVKFESKIVFALGRLQPGCRLMSCSHNCSGVSSQALYEFIKEQHPELDGDIESQVITALQSCVRSGIICALSDGKYRLIGPNPKGMVASCTRRLTHGPRCSCLALIGCMTKNFGKSCCSFSYDYTPLKLKCNKEIQTSENKLDQGNKCPSKKNLKRKLEAEKKNDEEEKNKICRKNSKSGDEEDKNKKNAKSADVDEKNKKCKTNSKVSVNADKGKSDGDAKNKDDGKCVTKKTSDSSNNTKNLKKKVKYGKTRASKRKFCSSCGKIRTLYLASKKKFTNYQLGQELKVFKIRWLMVKIRKILTKW